MDLTPRKGIQNRSTAFIFAPQNLLHQARHNGVPEKAQMLSGDTRPAVREHHVCVPSHAKLVLINREILIIVLIPEADVMDITHVV